MSKRLIHLISLILVLIMADKEWADTIPIENITATASNSQSGYDPNDTINGSGLNADDQHSAGGSDMWVTDILFLEPQPTWIQYEFDKVYTLAEMWVWNHNTNLEAFYGGGFKEVVIEYSIDGTTWTTLGDVHEFAQAPGTPNYEHNTTINFNSVEAKYVKLTVLSNWGGWWPQYGLSEVRFFQIPMPYGDSSWLFESPGKSTCYALPYEYCPPCPESEGVGDPIYAFSGEYYKSVVDLRIPGRGLDFIWARKYRSRISPNTAQGNGWDFSYNIRIEREDDNIVLFDGNTRHDRYLPQPNGTWAVDGFFQEFTQDNPNVSDSSFTLFFSDTSTWQFHRLDHPYAPGKISAITDRNENSISFNYDSQGRLVTIHDTLDTEAHNRDITIAYNQDGFIESVTDFIGRQVRYTYYQDGDIGGSFGDLKSVTTPAVTGTPTGNDFPEGKTTIYTYSKGFADEQLNHNLLTITDPKGQTYLTNIYDPAQNPEDLNFDRLVSQIWGDPDDILDIIYVQQDPSEQNGFAVIKAIVNDRMGNVQEYFFDSDNRRVVQRAYTGRADPDLPTTETQNRPIGKLRPDDPDFFETRWIYNADSLVSQIIYSNGNSIMNLFETDFDPSAPRRSRGNLREVHYLPGPLESLSSQSMIIESYEYDTNLGSCCGTNFVTREIDGRGNETLHEYDDRGNRIHTQHRIPSIVEEWEYNEFGQTTKHTLPDNGSGHHRMDVYTYYSDLSDPQNGYLKSVISDAANLALTSTYEYDAVGNLTSVTDPRGNDSRYVYNKLDQVVRRISRRVTSPNNVRYEIDTYYDKNDNVVRVDTQNVDDHGILQANTHFTTIYEYDILNYLIRQSAEVGHYTDAIPGPTELPSSTGLPNSEFINTEYEYDANRNRTLIRYGEATEDRQSTNVVRTLYDERDLVFREIRAEGDPNQSTTQYDYDKNGNVKRALYGLEDSPRTTISTYDGYDRLVASTDPMGNVITFDYDENNNPISRWNNGELADSPNGESNVRLSETTYLYDAMDRLIRTEVSFFDSSTQISIDDGLSVTTTEYSDTSQVIRVSNDNSHATETTYDTANRVLTVTDAKGNTLTYIYDENSNPISSMTVEKSDIGNPDQIFTSTSVYDNLDRLIQSIDNVGNTHEYYYDSRNNLTRTVDALDHEKRFVYDGISRLIQTILDLDNDGADGDGDDITTGQTWDDTSRLTARIDDNGNTTTYIYDALNRSIRTIYADSTQDNISYDVHNNRVKQKDSNGSVVASTYDLLNRLTKKTIIPGPGVSHDTTFENYTYDGLSRVVRAEDDDSAVTFSYNSLSNATSETLNGQTITCVYDGIGNKVSCTYPGGRQIDCMFDEVERKRAISDDSGTIAIYNYVGPSRVERREYGNSTRTDYAYDGITGVPNPAGDFGVRQVIATRHTQIASGTIIDHRTYKWDPMYKKVQRKDVRAGGPKLNHDYQYDSVYRLVHTAVTDAGTTLVWDEAYQLDGVGNRTQVSGGTNPGIYTMDPTMPVSADFQMNQYTTTPADTRAYDENGNLATIDDGLSAARQLSFDYRDQLVEYIGEERHTYAYDAFGRRIARVVDADGAPQETRYFYDGWRVCEEQDPSGATQATYAYGLYIDEVLNMRRGGQDYYYHTDDRYNVVAVTDSAGAVRERYEYADYGSPLDLTTLAPVAADPSALDNPYLFQGRRFDPETGFYYFRQRYLDPEQGRFVSRDSLGLWGDPGNRGNAYSFCGNDPVNRLDPFGLDDKQDQQEAMLAQMAFDITLQNYLAPLIAAQPAQPAWYENPSPTDAVAGLPTSPAASTYWDHVYLAVSISIADEWSWCCEGVKDEYPKYKAGTIKPNKIRHTNCWNFINLVMEFTHHGRNPSKPPKLNGKQHPNWDYYMMEGGGRTDENIIMKMVAEKLPDYAGYFTRIRKKTETPKRGDLFIVVETDASGSPISLDHAGLFRDATNVVHNYAPGTIPDDIRIIGGTNVLDAEPRRDTFKKVKKWAKGSKIYVLEYHRNQWPK